MGNLTPKAESAQRCGKLAKLGCRVRRCRLSASIDYIILKTIAFHLEPFIFLKHISYRYVCIIPVSGNWDRKDLLGKLSTIATTKRNACRNIHRLIKRTKGVTLDIPLDTCEVHVKRRKPVKRMLVHWPMIRMDSWLAYFLQQMPEVILGGHSLEDEGSWRQMFQEFWATYRRIDPTHKIFADEGTDLSACIPYMLHGDEGRGACKKPFLVLSWQAVIGVRGPKYPNDSVQLATTYGTFFRKSISISSRAPLSYTRKFRHWSLKAQNANISIFEVYPLLEWTEA